jgi:hypothetical protein
MTKVILIVVSVLIAGFVLLFWPFLYDGFHSAAQIRALQHRSDFSQIAAACVTLARAASNDLAVLQPSDPRVPPVIRLLSPSYICAGTNSVGLEFHGGFDHYGYQVRQSDTNPKEWTLSFYTEQEFVAKHLGHKAAAGASRLGQVCNLFTGSVVSPILWFAHT